MTNTIQENSKDVVKTQATSQDYVKIMLSLQTATVEEIIEYASKNFDFDNVQIKSLNNVLNEVKANSFAAILAWDTSKPTDENIAYITGTLIQNFSENLVLKAALSGGLAVSGAFPVFLTSLIIAHIAKEAGINLGEEFEKIYEYTKDFQAVNEVEQKRFENLKNTNPKEYQIKVAQGLFPENTVIWNKHINEITKDLHNRKEDNLEESISYTKKAYISEELSIEEIAMQNNLTIEQLLDYNNLNIKKEDYKNIKEDTKIAIPHKVEQNQNITLFTDEKGNQKIISKDETTDEKTIFYYNAKDYSLIQISKNIHLEHKVNKEGEVSIQKLGTASIEVLDKKPENNIETRTISNSTQALKIDENSKITAFSQLVSLLRIHTNNNLSLDHLAFANGFCSKEELIKAFKNNETIYTPTEHIILTDKNEEKVSTYIINNKEFTPVKAIQELKELSIQLTKQLEQNQEEKIQTLEKNFEEINSKTTLEEKLEALKEIQISKPLENFYSKQLIDQYQEKVLEKQGIELTSLELLNLKIEKRTIPQTNEQKQEEKDYISFESSTTVQNNNSQIQTMS